MFGGDLDGYNSYAQRGNLPMMEHIAEAGMALMPMIGKAKIAALMGGHQRHDDGWLSNH